MANQPKNSTSDREIANYCVAFIDLLGQKAALEGHGLLPEPCTEEERTELHRQLRQSVGAIIRLQERAATLVKARPTKDSITGLRETLDSIGRAQWDAMAHENVKTQRWSDGLMHFASLADPRVICQMNNVMRLVSLAGCLCFLGLAERMPIRGALEIAWGAELHEGELYGAAVARAYELESQVAQYPRIVVGQRLIEFIQFQSKRTPKDIFETCDRDLALTCMSMLKQDADAQWIVDYVGRGFRDAVTEDVHEDLFKLARNFAYEQLKEHAAKEDAKLAGRYKRLIGYLGG